MATVPLIFPSLSRQPSMDSSKSTEDDTIRDNPEQGYVATRPRFTRVRDTWKVNVRNLVAEDVRVLDQFQKSPNYAARGGNAFLIPNLLPNWSFEFGPQSADELVFGWGVGEAAPEIAVATTGATVADGVNAVQFATVAGQSVPANSTVAAELGCDWSIPCNPGETYVFNASLNIAAGTLAAGALAAQVAINYFDSNSNPLSVASGPLAAEVNSWQPYSYQFTVPANAATFTVAFSVSVVNSTGAPLPVDGSTMVTIDAVGCALLTAVQIYGKMFGSQPLGKFVRFTKLAEFSDIGIGNGVLRYGTNFEVTEV
jgi:hypothetical protein